MFAELLRARLDGIFELPPGQIERMRQHYELLVRWNQVLNLTSVRNVEEAVERHYCESVFAAIHLPVGELSIADIGSGGGFPGIPMAIVRPDCRVALVESHQRKATFLREGARDLKNVHVVAERAESVKGEFDWVACRAVRYSDISGSLKRLGRNAVLLTGEVRAEELPGFEWQEPIRLPWGDRRYLWIGQVSRGT